MAVLPISSVNVKSNSNRINFGMHRAGDREESSKSYPRSSNPLKTVPVAVLIAMSPAMANSVPPATPASLNSEAITELLNQSPENLHVATYSKNLIEEPIPACYARWKGLRTEKILMHKIVSGNDTKYHMFFTSTGRDGVSQVYLIKDDTPGCEEGAATPPNVMKLIYHNIGKDKEFCGVKTIESIIGRDGKSNGALIREIRLDDDAANLIIDLITNNSKWKNLTTITVVETNSEKLMTQRVSDY